MLSKKRVEWFDHLSREENKNYLEIYFNPLQKNEKDRLSVNKTRKKNIISIIIYNMRVLLRAKKFRKYMELCFQIKYI